jgi:hypothetical protein
MSEPSKEKGWWLPESYELKLTAFELGTLLSVLVVAQAEGKIATFYVNKRPAESKTITRIRMIDRLIEKAVALTGDTNPKPETP